MELELDLAGVRVFVPDGQPVRDALARTTHLIVGAHPDDVELMAWSPILDCMPPSTSWLTAVIATDGAGAPRYGEHAELSTAEMVSLREEEQRAAAKSGHYGAVVCLGLPSSAVRDASDSRLVDRLLVLLGEMRPRQVFTHAPTDRHQTHLAVCLATIEALRGSPSRGQGVQSFLGCEVWGGLDWLARQDKVALDVSSGLEQMAPLMAVYASQMAGGKAYDQAARGRRIANAAFADPYCTESTRALELTVDLMPLLADPLLSVHAFARGLVDRFWESIEVGLLARG